MATEISEQLKQTFKPFIESTVKSWDAYDIKARDDLKARNDAGEFDNIRQFDKFQWGEKDWQYSLVETKEWKAMQKLPWELLKLSDEEIHDKNTEDAENLVANLDSRVSKHIGEVKDYSGLYVDGGNDGSTILNGFVSGENGKVKVKSVLAGGYNIQRLHIRTTVSKVKA